MKSKSPLLAQVSYYPLFFSLLITIDKNEPIQRNSKSTLEIDASGVSLRTSNLRVIEHTADVKSDV